MCSRISCPSCKRPTYSGCGRHVELVLADVAESDRCRCTGSLLGRTVRSWFGTTRNG